MRYDVFLPFSVERSAVADFVKEGAPENLLVVE